jgi:hypothetical protein
MKIEVDFSSLRGTKPHEYAVRFLFGGFITLVAALIAKRYGPSLAGLFLAFPAIFPAGATMIAKHERQKKARSGMDGTMRGRAAAALDASGAALGALGLIVFAAIIWICLPRYPAVAVLAAATVSWLAVSISLWHFRKML